MPTNYERVSKRFIPAFRLRAANMMVKEFGSTQQRAAVVLGTTQAAISKYLKYAGKKFGDVNIDEGMLREFIKKTELKEEDTAQKIMCTMCQSNKRFDCAFIVK